MRISLILIFVVLLSSICFAEDYYARGQTVDIVKACIYSTQQPCNSTTSCNVTIKYPNSSLEINNAPMTYNGGYANYSLGVQNILGQHSGMMFCSDGVNYGYDSFTYTITDNGMLGNDYTFILAVGIIIFFLLALGLVINADAKFGIGIKVTCFLFSLLFALLIPGSFTSVEVKPIFWGLIIGFLLIFGIQMFLYGIYIILANMGVVGRSDK
jgi:hypothetical protein